MDVREAGNRVAYRLVDRAGRVAPRHVHDGDVLVRRGDRRRQHLAAVALQEHELRPHLLDDPGHRHHRFAQRARHRGAGESRVPRRDVVQRPVAIGFDLREARRELGREVHAGHDQLELQVRRRGDRRVNRAHGAVFGARAGNREYLARHD